MTAIVYWAHLPSHTDVRTQGYVGFSRYPLAVRSNQHRKNARLRNARKNRFYEALQDHSDAVQFRVLCVGAPEYCLDLEHALRPTQNIGWNMACGGDAPALGRVMTAEHKAKIDAAKRGRPRSEETKRKLSEALKGNQCAKGSVRTPEMRAAHSARMKGFRHSDEARAKISAAQRRKDMST